MTLPPRVATAGLATHLGAVLAAICAAFSACGPAPTTSPAPTATAAAAPTTLVVGCASIESVECHFVAQQIVAMLPPERGRPFSIEIQLSGCANDGPCPPTLAARPGRAVVEYADAGEPITVSLDGPPQTPRIAVQAGQTWSDLVRPTSQQAPGLGPFPFELGHCGLSHVVDFDGSFWVPVGPVDGDAPGIINAESGQMRLLGPDLALYEGPTGFSATLARFPGPKHFFLCD